MAAKEIAVKILASCIITAIGLFWSCFVLGSLLYNSFRKGFGNVFSWKDRTKDGPPFHYKAWDAETRRSPGLTTKRWNHAYVTVPESGLRFHYVYSGKFPSHLTISDVDGETSKVEGAASSKDKSKLLLCAHGYPENWFSWRHILRYFDDTREELDDYFVVAFDLRGYGDSDKPLDYKSYHINNLVCDVRGVAQSLGYEKFTLVGHDWGGAVSWGVRRVYPEILEKMIIMNCPDRKATYETIRKKPGQLLKSWYMFFFQIPYLAELMCCVSDYKLVENSINGKSGIVNPESRLTGEEMEVFKYGVRHSVTGPINYYRAMLWPFSSPGPPLQYPRAEKGKRPDVPTLIIWGEQDFYLVKELAENSMKYLNPKQSKLVFVKGASHWVQQDAPDETIHHMVQFLKETK